MTSPARVALPLESPLEPAGLSILIVDDTPEDAEHYIRLLGQAPGVSFTFRHAELGEDGLRLLQEQVPDCLLLDYHLPDMTGLEFLREMRGRCPVILLTGMGDEAIAVAALQAGAQDYLVKSQIVAQTFGRAVQRAQEKFLLERALDLAHTRMSALLSSVREGMVALSPDLTVLYHNPAARVLLHWENGERLPAWVTDLPVFRSGVQDVMRDEPVPPAEVRCGDTWLELQLQRQTEGLTLTLRDVTQRRLEVERLRLLESVAVTAREAVVIAEANPTLDPGPKVVYVNRAFTRMTGYAPEDIVGLTPRILQGPLSDRRTLDRVRDRLARWQTVDETLLNYDKSGRPFWVHLSITPVADETGWYTHWVSVQRDVTEERRQQERERLRREVLEMAAEFRPVPDILDAVCRKLEISLPEVVTTAWLRSGETLTLAASGNAAPSDLREALRRGAGVVVIGEGQGATARAVQERTLVVVEDVQATPGELRSGAAGLLGELGLHGVWSVPILSAQPGREPFGALTVFTWQSRRPPTPEELTVLQDAASLAALILESMTAHQEVQRQALYDSLTGLPNRSLFLEHLQRQLNETPRHRQRVAVGLMDLNRFKTINDTLGHSAGDALLVQVAERLRATFRPSDIVARMGGDEFTLMLPFTSDVERFRQGIEARLRECFTAPFVVQGQQVFVTGSLGLAITPDHGHDREQLLSAADVAMYAAKRTNQGLQVYDPSGDAHDASQVTLESDLYRALERGELELHYQPIYRAGRRELVGAEALIRWNHARCGMISPAKFIPLAESTGLIVPIGRWVLREACRQLVRWRERAPHLTLSVNLSARQFWQPELVRTVQDAMRDMGAPPEGLVLEITESVLMDVPDAQQTLTRLKGLGVRLSLDDFGTGYSSLSYLHRFPLDALKIDRSFVIGVRPESDGTAETIIRSVMVMAHSLNLSVTTEGIETEHQARFIEDLNGDLLQGFLLSRPLPVAAFGALLP
ncbi:EAL domain-containing protein [Deinococcus aquiradiocola]|uniref:Diguanylate cyclase n=1 Tax=Deinococcus aquiradiocola TaxID=393059 RepID=A0A917P935_9DEIO|nr:EAL domain-containing protein [Deinococcus aquiradiocola]GGJ66955.1 hypothetical protein GCM10008939_08950 [Deinococcus aquiradiocola]